MIKKNIKKNNFIFFANLLKQESSFILKQKLV